MCTSKSIASNFSAYLTGFICLFVQDIFECRTCGLTGSLCCCTECAYTCHRGHDCSFKRVSPTAYCDCWEMCKCKALAPSSDYERKSLLIKLLGQTTLGTKVNSSHEHLLGMLASMVARQAKEQAHWSGRQLTRSGIKLGAWGFIPPPSPPRLIFFNF